jgi:isochorismate synthase EntC
MTSPWATEAGWRDAPYPRLAVVDDDRLVVAEGARRTFAAPSTSTVAASLAAVPTDAFVVGCARFAPAALVDVDPRWAPLGGALWFEPAQHEVVLLDDAVSSRSSPARAAHASTDVVDLDGARFRSAVADALGLIARGDVDKLVLARRFFVPMPGAFARVPALFSSLLSSTTFGATAYLVSPCAGTALMGLSPERLVVVDDDVRADAVAGTRATARAHELLVSDKDAREHALVVEHLRAALSSTGTSASVGPRGLRTVGEVTHLHTVVHAPRTSSSSAGSLVTSLVEALHPTPAVAGWPVDDARRYVPKLERFDRGLYGGVVGVVGPRRTSLSVALRGALVTDDGLLITVGAGVVAGSTVDGEDAETRLKLDAVLASFGLCRGTG